LAFKDNYVVKTEKVKEDEEEAVIKEGSIAKE
jgi:hypothetical protein